MKDSGIAERHARGCRHRAGRCSCTATFKVQVWDAKAGKRITRSFDTITAARRWRQDAYASLRAGTLTADRGPTLEGAARDWLEAARAGIIRSRSGQPFKPSTLRAYDQNLRLRLLPALGRERLGEITLPQVQRYVDRLAADGLAAETIATSVAPLRAIYARAVRLGEVQVNPTRDLALPAPRAPERADRHARGDRTHPRCCRPWRPGAVGDRRLRRSPSRGALCAPPGGRRLGCWRDPRPPRLGQLRG
jgi:Phage integrase, N-terminal SAM-like domain